VDLSVQVAERGGWTVVLVGGEVDLTTAPKLREQLLRLIADGKRHLVVDLAGVDFCDSTGLGVLIGTAKRARADGGDVEVSGLTPGLVRLFELTRLDQAFAIHADLDAVPARGG
jgi:anti-sigma B factor antagonist